ncbi:hypothetical protein ACRALDRAFT_1070796 [Sodiomyces alcalophilus JCM 7366]|uniref:uncharacterized protein n=1 Tax=Sodiomyces alcalophilus JCM 7366 TaxID=591952 RepID=UPI0039B61C30
MWLFTIFFVFWRFMQITTLIPVVGMLAWFVQGYVESNALTPDYILILFIVSVLALAWALFTLFSYHRSSTNATWVAIVDLLFVGALIGSVYALRHIRNVDCNNVARDADWNRHFASLGVITTGAWDWVSSKPCSMLKACWAFAIMNLIMFFFTSFLAWFSGDGLRRDTRYDNSYRDGARSSSRHHHRHRSSSRRSRSYQSRPSSHSRRVYV